MGMVELMLDDGLIEAIRRRARKDGVTFRDIVVHSLESAVAVRDLLDQEPESRGSPWPATGLLGFFSLAIRSCKMRSS
jgi:hypothetical protein